MIDYFSLRSPHTPHTPLTITLSSLSFTIECAAHYGHMLRQYPVPNDPTLIFSWSVFLHNQVRRWENHFSLLPSLFIPLLECLLLAFYYAFLHPSLLSHLDFSLLSSLLIPFPPGESSVIQSHHDRPTGLQQLGWKRTIASPIVARRQ